MPTGEKLVTVSLLLDKLEMPVQDLGGEKRRENINVIDGILALFTPVDTWILHLSE